MNIEHFRKLSNDELVEYIIKLNDIMDGYRQMIAARDKTIAAMNDLLSAEAANTDAQSVVLIRDKEVALLEQRLVHDHPDNLEVDSESSPVLNHEDIT